MNCAAWRPMAVPSMRTVVSAGCRSAANSRSPKPTTASCSGTATPRACASVMHARGPAGPSCRTRRRCPARSRSSSASAARPLLSVVGAGTRTTATSGSPAARAASWKASQPPHGTLVVAGDHRQPAPAAGVQEVDHRAADLRVREAHQHVERRRRQVPGLDHRNAGGQQALAALGRMHDAGQHDAVGAAADDGLEQRVLARIDVAALAQHQLVAALGQRLRSATARSAGTPGRRWSAPPPPPAGCASTPARRPARCARSRCARPPRSPSAAPRPRPAAACSARARR